MFGLKKKQEHKAYDLEIRFHTEAARHGRHGQIQVSHVRKGIKHRVVNFVIVGFTQPPQVTPGLMQYIWDEAKAQGYVPHEFVGALEINEADDDLSGSDTLSHLDSVLGDRAQLRRPAVARTEAQGEWDAMKSDTPLSLSA